MTGGLPQRGRGGLVLGVGLLVTLAALTLVVPLWTPDPDATDYARKLAPPSWDAPLGTDEAGRDVLARLAAGAWRSLGAAVLIGVLTYVAGLLVGVTAALCGGVVDTVLSRLVDVMLAVPTLVSALAVVGVLGPGFGNLVVAMTLAGWAPLARLARSWAREHLTRPYVTAARLAGVPRWRAAVSHVLPATGVLTAAVATLGIGEIMLGLSALSFLGLGVAPPAAEWGQMVAESRWYAARAPWLVLAPGAAIAASVACAALLGDALQDATTPRGAR